MLEGIVSKQWLYNGCQQKFDGVTWDFYEGCVGMKYRVILILRFIISFYSLSERPTSQLSTISEPSNKKRNRVVKYRVWWAVVFVLGDDGVS